MLRIRRYIENLAKYEGCYYKEKNVRGKRCPFCNELCVEAPVPDPRLKERYYRCEKCGIVFNRDYCANARLVMHYAPGVRECWCSTRHYWRQTLGAAPGRKPPASWPSLHWRGSAGSPLAFEEGLNRGISPPRGGLFEDLRRTARNDPLGGEAQHRSPGAGPEPEDTSRVREYEGKM